MAIVFCHKERGISVEEENHLVTVGIVKKSKTILVLLASPIAFSFQFSFFIHVGRWREFGRASEGETAQQRGFGGVDCVLVCGGSFLEQGVLLQFNRLSAVFAEHMQSESAGIGGFVLFSPLRDGSPHG